MSLSIVKTLPALEAFETLNLPGKDKNLFSSLPWLRVMKRAYRPRLFIKYIERHGTIAAWVPYSVVKNFLEWKVCVLSYCDYCDGHVENPEDWKNIFDVLEKEFPGYRIVARTLRDEAARSCGCFKELSREYFHHWDVSKSTDDVWKGLKGVFRNQVRQAVRRGLTTRVLSKEELYKFFMIHVRLRKKKYGIFAQPYKFFQMIWEEYMDEDNGFILGAFAPNGEMVGATVFLVCGDTLYYKVNTSILGALEYRSNNLLLWEGMCLAKKKGLKYVDLGSSGYDQKGLVSFKDATGAKRQEIVHIGFHPQGYVFSQKRILRFYTQLFNFSWVPDEVTAWGSRLIYHFLA